MFRKSKKAKELPVSVPSESEAVAEKPAVEEPVAEEPAVEEPVAEEPAVEEPVAEESAVEEPVAEEPAVEEAEVEKPRRRKTGWLLFGILIALAVVAFAIGQVMPTVVSFEQVTATDVPATDAPATDVPETTFPKDYIEFKRDHQDLGELSLETLKGYYQLALLVGDTEMAAKISDEMVSRLEDLPAETEEPEAEEPVVEEPEVEEAEAEEPEVEEPEVEEAEAEEPEVEEPAAEELNTEEDEKIAEVVERYKNAPNYAIASYGADDGLVEFHLRREVPQPGASAWLFVEFTDDVQSTWLKAIFDDNLVIAVIYYPETSGLESRVLSPDDFRMLDISEGCDALTENEALVLMSRGMRCIPDENGLIEVLKQNYFAWNFNFPEGTILAMEVQDNELLAVNVGATLVFSRDTDPLTIDAATGELVADPTFIPEGWAPD